MIQTLTGGAARLDGWLHERLGRPYGVILSIGLIGDIIHRIIDAPRLLQERPHLIGVILAVAMELALLLHQVAEMHGRISRRHGAGGAAPPNGEEAG